MAEERTGGNRRLWTILADIAFDIAGCGLLAIGIQVFTAPNNIAPGGVSGIAVILNHLTGLPIGGISFLINLPLMALGLRFLGKRFTLRTFKSVVILSLMVDYVVVAPPEEHQQHYGSTVYDAGLAHEYRIPVKSLPPLAMSERKIIARRSAMELIPGGVINLGIGMPEGVSGVAVEEGVSDQIIMSVESGHVGGVPVSGLGFGGCYNSEYVSDMTRQFDFYDGGGLSASFLGSAEVDEKGNVNVSKFKKTVGPGGFINIAQATKNMVFCGTLTAGGLKVSVKDGKLHIDQEGRNKKFVKQVQQVTFSGEYAAKSGQNVLYVTERAVFKLTEEGVVLVEIAPGIDLQTQVLDMMEFAVKVSPDLKEMDARIFREEKMGLTL